MSDENIEVYVFYNEHWPDFNIEIINEKSSDYERSKMKLLPKSLVEKYLEVSEQYYDLCRKIDNILDA